jgi:hypothetical protein
MKLPCPFFSQLLATQEAEIRRSMVQSQSWANSSMRPYLKKRKIGSQKRTGGVASGVGLEIKPQDCKNKSK